MKIREQNSKLSCVCGRVDQFPKPSLPELAFAGKSNVGKSTLINMLLGRKNLARTSSVPGKTQTINWYNIDDQLFFVDLPGYGYAKASKTDQVKWGKVIETYLNKRETLRCVLLLVDIRHAPSANDLMMMDFLRHYQVKTVIVATKADKVTRNQLPSQIKMLASELRVEKSDIIPVSSLSKMGREVLWEKLIQMAEGEETGGSPVVGE